MSVSGNTPRFSGLEVTDPTVNDDESRGYFIGSVWVNNATGVAYMCANSAPGAALWTPLRPDIISVYDNLGNQTFTGRIAINLDTVKKNTNTNIYSLASDIVTISQPGTYLFLYECSLQVVSGTSRSQCETFLQENSGSGWNEVEGSRARTYNRINNAGATTSASGLAFDIASNTQIRLVADRIFGNSTIGTVLGGSRVTIMRIL